MRRHNCKSGLKKKEGKSLLLICKCMFNSSPLTLVTVTQTGVIDQVKLSINALFCYLSHLFLFLFHLSDQLLYVQL